MRRLVDIITNLQYLGISNDQIVEQLKTGGLQYTPEQQVKSEIGEIWDKEVTNSLMELEERVDGQRDWTGAPSERHVMQGLKMLLGTADFNQLYSAFRAATDGRVYTEAARIMVQMKQWMELIE